MELQGLFTQLVARLRRDTLGLVRTKGLFMATIALVILVLAWQVAAGKQQCFCFDWVHGPEWGRECHPSMRACETAKKQWGKSGMQTACKASQEDKCIKWGCTSPGGKCYQYGCPHDAPDGGATAAPPANEPSPARR